MGTHSLTDIWHHALGRLSQRMDDPSLKAWLSDTQPLGLHHEVMTVQFPNAFTRDWVAARYSLALEQVMHELTGRLLRLQFVLPHELPAPRNGGSSPADHSTLIAGSTQRTHAVSMLERMPPRIPPRPSLQPRYTFETFVVGSGNRFPHAAALAVAEGPGKAYNPLFLYGGVGLGKTHLMQAIGHRVLEHSPHLHVMYVTSETFTNDLINSISRKSTEEFRNRYRSVDVLMIDDVHFVAGKESTQEEFFHTFNALYEANKQIILSSDRPPKDIPTLEERLRSRFEWGLTADLQMPDLETRIAILRHKAQNDELPVPANVLSYIAERIQSNVRELEGALVKVLALASVHGVPVTMDLAKEALKDVAAVHQAPVTIAAIQQTVAAYFNISEADMRARRRHREVVFPRQLAMYLARELTDASLPRIGQEFGGRDHSTVVHACEKVRSRLEQEPELADTVRSIKRLLENPGR